MNRYTFLKSGIYERGGGGGGGVFENPRRHTCTNIKFVLPTPTPANFIAQFFYFGMEVNTFYAPNFKEVKEAYWFGPVCMSIDLSVCLSVMLALG